MPAPFSVTLSGDEEELLTRFPSSNLYSQLLVHQGVQRAHSTLPPPHPPQSPMPSLRHWHLSGSGISLPHLQKICGKSPEDWALGRNWSVHWSHARALAPSSLQWRSSAEMVWLLWQRVFNWQGKAKSKENGVSREVGWTPHVTLTNVLSTKVTGLAPWGFGA